MDTVISTAQLRERGWTAKLIKEFLSLPDTLRPNPHYPSARPMRLYRVDRITEIERQAEFREAREAAGKQQAAAKKALQTKRTETVRWVESQPGPRLPEVPCDELVARAVNWFNETEAWEEPPHWASIRDPAAFLHEIVVDYILEKFAEHEAKLLQSFGRVARDEAAAAFRRKVITAITAAFPWLAEECQRRLGHEEREAVETQRRGGSLREAELRVRTTEN